MLTAELLPEVQHRPSSSGEILRLTGAGKSQAYECLRDLRQAVSVLDRPPGRPSAQRAPEAEPTAAFKVAFELIRHLLRLLNLDSASNRHRTYPEHHRRFILSLLEPDQPGSGMPLEEFSLAVDIPLGTLKTWLRLPPANASQDPQELPPEPVLSELSFLNSTRLQLIARLWTAWEGTFLAFCTMLRTQERMPYGATFVGNFLQGIGLRQRRRQGPIEAPWSSGTFRTYFPSAQWLGDGMGINFCWGGETFTFNLEAIVDPAVGSVIGISVTDAEDEASVRLAYEHAVMTTGSRPLAMSLDNRPSNHSPATRKAVGATLGGRLQIPLQDAMCLAHSAALAAICSPSLACGSYSPRFIEGTLLIRSTPGRGQAKAPCEGAFGLFSQALPDLVLDKGTPRDMAREALHLIATAWFRGSNGKPRKRLGNLSPAQAYTNSRPTPEQLAEARAAFIELLRREEQARMTGNARRDPVRLELLERGLADLNISDPEGRLARCLAYYAREAIVRGLATFQAKQQLGILPPRADHGRYLGGIIRNHHEKLELEFTSAYLLKQRLRLNDISLRPLQRAALEMRTETKPEHLPKAFVDRALAATWDVDFRYWSGAAKEAVSSLPVPARNALYPWLCRRVAASLKTDRDRRERLLDFLATGVATAA